MRLIFGIVLLAGLGLAGFAIHTVQQRIGEYQNALDNQPEVEVVETADVVVLQRQLKYGDVLRPDDVTTIKWPADYVPGGAFLSLEDVFPDPDEMRTVLRQVERFEPLMKSKVTAPGADAGLAASLTPGMRAFTLQVDVSSGVSGFLRPGDRVDVYWTGSGGQGGLTKLIHPNLPLIAVDQVTDEERNNPQIARTVTVEASPAIVAKLAQAQATGRLALALVGVNDDSESDTGTAATINEVLDVEQQEEVVVEQRRCVQRIRKGAEVVEIPCPNQEG